MDDNVYTILEEEQDEEEAQQSEEASPSLSERSETGSVSTTTPEFASDSEEDWDNEGEMRQSDSLKAIAKAHLQQQLPVVEILFCPSTPTFDSRIENVEEVQEEECVVKEKPMKKYNFVMKSQIPSSSSSSVDSFDEEKVESWAINEEDYQQKPLSPDHINEELLRKNFESNTSSETSSADTVINVDLDEEINEERVPKRVSPASSVDTIIDQEEGRDELVENWPIQQEDYPLASSDPTHHLVKVEEEDGDSCYEVMEERHSPASSRTSSADTVIEHEEELMVVDSGEVQGGFFLKFLNE